MAKRAFKTKAKNTSSQLQSPHAFVGPGLPQDVAPKASTRGATSTAPVAFASPRPQSMSPSETQSFRELFWQNVLREMLVSLIASQAHAQMQLEASKAASTDKRERRHEESNESEAVSSDGRVGIITNQGTRIPIARIFPVFAQSMEPGPAHDTREVALAQILQCTVFQIETPNGEVYTLPLQEIRGFHALSEKLMEQIASKARRRARKGEPEQAEPFGFAAFTRTARQAATPPDQADQTTPAGAD